jgi:hypothetical protein
MESLKLRILKDVRFVGLYSIALVDRQAIETRRESVGWSSVRRLGIAVRSPLNGPMRQKILFSLAPPQNPRP